MKQTYCDIGSLAAGAAATISTVTFSCNDLFDPNVTGTGHQPMYFDQLTTLYNHFTVTASRCTFKIISSISNQPPCVGCLWIDDNSTTTATRLEYVGEAARAGPLRVFGQNENASTNFYAKWNARAAFPGNPLGNNLLQGTGGASPNELQYYKFSYYVIDGTASTLYYTVTIDYDVVWSELKEVTAS